MEFEVKPKKLNIIVSDQKDIQQRLNKLNSELEDCKKSLKGCMSSSAGSSIDKALGSVQVKIRDTAGGMGIMGNKLEVIAAIYTRAETDIAGSKPSPEGVKDVKSDAKYSSKVDSKNSLNSDSKDVSDAINELNKLLKAGSSALDKSELDALTAYLGLLSSSIDLRDSKDFDELFKNLLGYSGDYLEFSSQVTSAVEKLVKESDSEMIKAWLKTQKGQDIFGAKTLGTASDMISLVESAYNACHGSDSWQETVRKFSGSTSKVGTVYMDLKGLEGAEKKAFKNGVVAPYAALGSIALYSLGTEKKHEGNYTWQDVADLWMGAGMSGANSMLSGATFGIVNLDVDTFLDNVHDNVNKATDKIAEQGGPMWWQVTEALALTPAVAAWSVGETAFDTGVAIGNNIKKIFR